MSKLKMSIVIGVLLIGVALAYAGYVFISRIGKAPIDIMVAPSDTSVIINDDDSDYSKKFTGSKIVYLAPGSYTIAFSYDGFANNEQSLTVKNTDSQRVIAPLVPETEEAEKVSQAEQPAYDKIETVAGQQAQEEGVKFTQKNPITEYLPHESLLYTIGYRADPKKKDGIIIEIDAEKGYRNAAIREIQEFGFDPASYNIVFRDFANPFTHYLGGTS